MRRLIEGWQAEAPAPLSPWLGRVSGAAWLAALAVAAVYAQHQTPIKVEESDLVFRADTRLVVCHTSVIDKTGHLVTGLPKSAFSVTENGAP
jgi:hypothetical protein